jgi:hypothetical protein
MKPHLKMRIDFARLEAYLTLREDMVELWNLVKAPVKFPAPSRRRRGDREIPKAA